MTAVFPAELLLAPNLLFGIAAGGSPISALDFEVGELLGGSWLAVFSNSARDREVGELSVRAPRFEAGELVSQVVDEEEEDEVAVEVVSRRCMHCSNVRHVVTQLHVKVFLSSSTLV